MDILKSCKVEGHLYSMCVWARVKCVCLPIHLLLCLRQWLSPEDGDSSCSVNEWTCVCVRVRLCVWESSKASGKDRAWTSSQHTSCGCYTRTTHTVLQVNQPTADHFVSLSRRRKNQVVVCLPSVDVVVCSRRNGVWEIQLPGMERKKIKLEKQL